MVIGETFGIVLISVGCLLLVILAVFIHWRIKRHASTCPGAFDEGGNKREVVELCVDCALSFITNAKQGTHRL